MIAHVFWFTGLSGSGKTTICDLVYGRLVARGLRTTVLDGDDVRHRLHGHLGFSPSDIRENNALIADLCETERQRCDIVLVPIISPFRDSRALARERLSPSFSEIYFDASIATVVERDIKGLYAKAARGEIDPMIGTAPSVPYEPPEQPELALHTMIESVEISADRLFAYIATVRFNCCADAVCVDTTR